MRHAEVLRKECEERLAVFIVLHLVKVAYADLTVKALPLVLSLQRNS